LLCAPLVRVKCQSPCVEATQATVVGVLSVGWGEFFARHVLFDEDSTKLWKYHLAG